MLTNIASGSLQSAQAALTQGACSYIIKSDHKPRQVVKIVEEVLNQGDNRQW